MKIKSQTIIILTVLFTVGCFRLIPSTTSTITEKNIAAIYNPSSTTIHPKFFVYQQNEENTLLYIYFYTPELLFLQTGSNKLSSAKVKVYYKIMESIENEELIDSATTYITIPKNSEQTSLVTFLKIKSIDLEKYVIQILIKDEYRKKSNIAFIEIDKTDKFGEQNFLVSYEDDLKPTFNNYFYSDQKYIIEYNSSISKLFVSYYKLDETLPLPPFSTKFEKFEYPTPDSIWTIDYKSNALFSQTKPGIYFIQTDTSQNSGKTLINLGDEFPILEKPSTLLEPLEYLTSTYEFENLKNIGSNKIAVDYFWLNTDENASQAKELIRIYYNRVMFANIYFTSYKEGWKTDRGMVYIIFGPPKIVNSKDGYEKWIYSDSRSVKTVEFEFYKRENKFTDKDYILQRNVSLKNFWTSAVETWLEGKIFTMDN
jgi:GWxTD domain-containing protein